MLKGKHDLGHGWFVYVGKRPDGRPTMTFNHPETDESTFLDADEVDRLRDLFVVATAARAA